MTAPRIKPTNTPDAAVAALPDRVPRTAILQKIGKAPRAAQNLAQRGMIPSAAKVGGTWTVVPAVIEAWLKQKEAGTLAPRPRHRATMPRST